MLIPVSSSIEAALSFESDDRKQDLLCDWIPRDEICPECLECDVISRDGYRESSSIRAAKDNAADSSSLVHSSPCRKFSTVINMCASPAPNIVYKRRKLQTDSVALLSAEEANHPKGCGACHYNMSSKDDSFGQIKNKTDSAGASVLSTGICSDFISNGSTSTSCQIHRHNLDGIPCTRTNKTKVVEVVSKSESLGGYTGGEEQQFDEAPDGKLAFECYNENDSFSSSKCIMELGSASMKTDNDMDDTGECSSSDFLSGENISEKELCISILKSHGLLGRGFPTETCASIDGLGIIVDSKLCKICDHTGNPLKMLICDNCEDAFHVSCCNPKIKKIPDYEWYCHSCSRKKHKVLESTTKKKQSKIKSGGSRHRNKASKRESSLIELMLNDSEPYTTNVRIGKGFQADVPEWSGPTSEEYDCFGEPTVIDPTECGSSDEWNTRNTNRLSKLSVGNWLQCREALDDSTGENDGRTICGKWRRAPLFEVQTEEWDCSCAVLWDPIHSDCAVPQELETDQVLMDLKYVQLLKRKLSSRPKRNTEDARTVPSQGGDS